jgi:hypothetical protein
MNTKLLLNESLYSLGHPVDEIYRNIIFPWLTKARDGIKNQKNAYNITEYIYPTIKHITKNVPIKMMLHIRESEKATEQAYETITPAGKKSRIMLSVEKKDLRKNYSGEAMKKYFKEYLTHELTHAIDKLRMGTTEFSDPDIRSPYHYIKDFAETNAYINQIITIANSNKKKWNAINSIDSLAYFLSKIPTLGGIFDDLRTKNPNGLKVIMKKIVRRLAREKALPKRMITS